MASTFSRATPTALIRSFARDTDWWEAKQPRTDSSSRGMHPSRREDAATGSLLTKWQIVCIVPENVAGARGICLFAPSSEINTFCVGRSRCQVCSNSLSNPDETKAHNMRDGAADTFQWAGMNTFFHLGFVLRSERKKERKIFPTVLTKIHATLFQRFFSF